MATKIGINDLSTELASMICNKFKLEKSIKIITENTVSIPIDIEFNRKLDELIVIKNSTVLNSDKYTITDSGTIVPTDEKVWSASKKYPVEFNFIVLKAALPGITASLWRNRYTLTTNAKSVPITVNGFNKNTDEIIVLKNGIVVAHDEYEIVEDMLVAANDGEWEATKRAPVNFEYVVLKFATPSNSIAINGYHLLDGTVGLDALNPEIKSLLTMVSLMQTKLDFLYDAIIKHGNYELVQYLKDNSTNEESEVMKKIEESNKAKLNLFKEYSKIDLLSKARHDAVIQKLEELGLIENLDKYDEENS